MTHFVADAIRAHIDNGAFLTDSDRALLAVVDKCEQMHEEAPIWGAMERRIRLVTDEVMTVVARELGINPEEKP